MTARQGLCSTPGCVEGHLRWAIARGSDPLMSNRELSNVCHSLLDLFILLVLSCFFVVVVFVCVCVAFYFFLTYVLMMCSEYFQFFVVVLFFVFKHVFLLFFFNF